MDGTGPLATPNDLYTRLGTASAPMLVDLRRQFAEALNVAWNTIAARVEQLMDSLGRTSPTFE